MESAAISKPQHRPMLVFVFEKPHGLDAQHENADVRMGCVPPVRSEHFLKHSPSCISSSSGHLLPSPIVSLGANGLASGSSVVLAGPAGGAVGAVTAGADGAA